MGIWRHHTRLVRAVLESLALSLLEDPAAAPIAGLGLTRIASKRAQTLQSVQLALITDAVGLWGDLDRVLSCHGVLCIARLIAVCR